MPDQNTSLKEIEIKLYANKNVMRQIYESVLFSKYSRSAWQTKELLNQYIDTNDYALTKAHVALRIRKDNDIYIQTLKARGNSVGGFSEREEIDWYLSKPELDISLLTEKYWPKELAQVDKKALQGIFSTDFIRHYSLFTWQHEGEEAHIEVALDTGVVCAGQKQDNISEVELELKQGSPKAMLAFAIELAEQFPLIPSDSSKAERGYRLLQTMSAREPDNKPIPSGLHDQLRYYLSESQLAWNDYLWQSDDLKVRRWFDLLEGFQKILVLEEIKPLALALLPIIDDWRLVISKGAEEQQLKASEEKNNIRWGLFVLRMSHWLLNHA